MPGKTCSMFMLAALVGAATATPHPECEPCGNVQAPELEALTASDKYLCCDLTCATTPVAGCGIFGLPIVCKACYNGDGTPAYDDDPIDGSPATTPSPVMPATPATPSPVTPATPSPVTPATPATPSPVMPMTPATTPSPVMPAPMPVTPSTPTPVMMPEDSDDDEVGSYSFDSGDGGCDACDEADAVLTLEDWMALEENNYVLECDSACFDDATLEGCGAFGLSIECRAVPLPGTESDPTPAPVMSVPSTFAPAPTPATGGGEGEGGGETTTGEGEGEGGGETTTGEGEGEGGGETTTGEGEGEGEGETTTGEGEGEGGGETTTGEGEGGGETTTGGDAGSCSDEEIAVCADITPVQEEALAMYDSGGKVIVCDKTCTDGVSDPTHCNYFGLGQLCRGCGNCSDCTPCP